MAKTKSGCRACAAIRRIAKQVLSKKGKRK